MKPIQTYPSMRAAVRELGADGFVAAVLRSQPWTSGEPRVEAPGRMAALVTWPARPHALVVRAPELRP